MKRHGAWGRRSETIPHPPRRRGGGGASRAQRWWRRRQSVDWAWVRGAVGGRGVAREEGGCAGLQVAGPGGAMRTLTLFFLLWHPLSDVWWLPTNRHRLHTNRHRLPTNRHRLPTNRHQLHTNRHRLPTGCHRRACWTLRVFFFSLWHPLGGARRTGPALLACTARTRTRTRTRPKPKAAYPTSHTPAGPRGPRRAQPTSPHVSRSAHVVLTIHRPPGHNPLHSCGRP